MASYCVVSFGSGLKQLVCFCYSCIKIATESVFYQVETKPAQVLVWINQVANTFDLQYKLLECFE